MGQAAQFVDAFLQESFQDSPVLASQLGLDGFFDQLGSDACDSAAERIDRDLLVSVLRGRAITEDWLAWRRQPEIYLNPGLGGVFSLFLHRLRPEPDLARAAASRLRQVPRVLEDGRRNVKAELAAPVYVERAMRQARAGARYARESAATEVF